MKERGRIPSLKNKFLDAARSFESMSELYALEAKDLSEQWEDEPPDHVKEKIENLQNMRGEFHRIATNLVLFIRRANDPLNHPPNS